MQPTEQTPLQVVLQKAADRGVTVTPDMLDYFESIKQKRQLELSAAAPGQEKTLIDRFVDRYPVFAGMMLKLGNLVMGGAYTLFVNFGVPVLLIVASIVEITRVSYGIEMFEALAGLAIASATVGVLLNLVLEFVIHYRESEANYQEKEKHDFSFKLVGDNLKYVLGWRGKGEQSTEFVPRPKSPAWKERLLLTLVQRTILILALTGSMRVIVDQQSAQVAGKAANWLSAIEHIITSATLKEMLSWIGSLLFTFMLVQSVQVLSRYVSHRVADLKREQNAIDPLVQRAETDAAMALLGVIKQVQRGGTPVFNGADMPSPAPREYPIPVNPPADLVTDVTDGVTDVTPVTSVTARRYCALAGCNNPVTGKQKFCCQAHKQAHWRSVSKA